MEDLTWAAHTTGAVKKAQQRLYFLRVVRRNNIPKKLLVSFYRRSIESILSYCLCVWFSSCTVVQRKILLGVIKVAQKITGCPLPTLEELHSSRWIKKAKTNIQDPSHPGHTLFRLLPSGRKFRSMKTRTNRLLNSFHPTSISALKVHCATFHVKNR